MRLGTRFDRLKEAIRGVLSSLLRPGYVTTKDGEHFELRRVA
jgi:hypothetical protein